MLAGGDRRSIGKSNEVVSLVLENPALFDIVFSGLLLDDPLIRMRCADAVEKITRLHPDYLEPYKTMLLEKLVNIDQPEVRWHITPMLVRLPLTVTEQESVFEILLRYLNDHSSLVRTFSLQALYHLAEVNMKIRPKVYQLVQEMTENGTPAVKARANKLLIKLMRKSSE